MLRKPIKLTFMLNCIAFHIKLQIYHNEKINPFSKNLCWHFEKKNLFTCKEGFVCGVNSMWNNFKTTRNLKENKIVWIIHEAMKNAKRVNQHLNCMILMQKASLRTHHSNEIFLLSSRGLASLLNIQFGNKMQIVAHFFFQRVILFHRHLNDNHNLFHPDMSVFISVFPLTPRSSRKSWIEHFSQTSD